MSSIDYRPCPFWSLNDRLEVSEIIRQVEEFHRAGMGGFFLHSRIGLITKYLGKEWMDALRAAIEKADELGMQAWLYDEDKWPSGFAGGIIPLQNPGFRGQYLGRIQNSADIPENAELVYSRENWNYFTAVVPLGIPEFNGTCYTDLMNPAAVKAYIESTHEKYKEKFGQYFGNVIPGIFTDEPIMRMRPNWLPNDFEYLPYSPCLLERYQKAYGESPFLHLTELFEDIEHSEKYRYRYWKTATEQFVGAYTMQVADWCDKNKLKLTGHFMYEDSIEDQTRWIGKAMAHYEYMQIPGIDHLGLNIDNILTAKQCSSVAHQQGKKQVLSEMFGAAGQNMSFEDRKWITGWHGVMGMNFVCHHLSLYSIRGCRKRDYPPTFTWHQPYWNDNAAIENWQARLSGLLAQGKPEADFLIIHPAESGWCLQKGGSADERLQEIDSWMKNICQEMFRSHRSFDFGDEDYLDRHAVIDSNKIVAGEMTYQAIILPQMLTIRKSTLELLEEFSKTGGIIVACGDMPELVDGENSNLTQILDNIIKFHISDISELEDMLNEACCKKHRISGKNTDKVFIRLQNTDEGELLFLFNSSRHDTAFIDWSRECSELCLDTGIKTAVVETPLILYPAQTRILLLGKNDRRYLPSTVMADYSRMKVECPWKISCKGLNSLPLDFAEWSTDGINWQAAEPVIALKARLDHEKFSGNLRLRYNFINNANNPKEVFIAAEFGKDVDLTVNGKNVDIGTDWFLDKCLLKTNISQQLVQGQNFIEFKLNYIYADPNSYQDTMKRYGTELETAFIIGDFGVYGKTVEAPELPKQVSHDIWPDCLPERRVVRIHEPYIADKTDYSDGELTTSGLPFYAGTVLMTTEFELPETASCRLDFEKLDAITGKVFINETAVPRILSDRPFELDISNLVKPGRNRLTVELKNSLRNLFGPHHSVMGELAAVGPYSFVSRDFAHGEYVPEIYWGLPEKRCLQKSWSDDYFVVRFGLSNINILFENKGNTCL